MNWMSKNPLQKPGRESPGTANMKIWILAVCILTGFTGLIFLLTGISEAALRADLQRTRQELTLVNPSADVVRAAQAAESANRKMRSEIENWSLPARPPMYSVLRAIQENLPPQVMLYHLVAEMKPEPLPCTLYLSGTVEGELVDVDAKRTLNADPCLRNFCGEIRLISSRRYFGKSRAFALEGGDPAGGDPQ